MSRQRGGKAGLWAGTRAWSDTSCFSADLFWHRKAVSPLCLSFLISKSIA